MDNLPSNYNGENMLVGANNLNNQIKGYLDRLEQEHRNIDNVVRSNLEEFRLDIEDPRDGFLPSIENYAFATPRSDRLTKEGVLVDLHINLDRINDILSSRSGGKKRKPKKTRKMRKSKRRTNKKGKSRRR